MEISRFNYLHRHSKSGFSSVAAQQISSARKMDPLYFAPCVAPRGGARSFFFLSWWISRNIFWDRDFSVSSSSTAIHLRVRDLTESRLHNFRNYFSGGGGGEGQSSWGVKSWLMRFCLSLPFRRNFPEICTTVRLTSPFAPVNCLSVPNRRRQGLVNFLFFYDIYYNGQSFSFLFFL